jgi:hypothetical protein
MLPGAWDLVLYRGDSRRFPVRFTDAETSDPHDLTGLEWHAQIRESYDSQAIVATFNVVETDPANGQIELRLTAASARALLPTGVWDLQSLDVDGNEQTWLTGNVTVMPDVTRLP